MLSRSRMRRLEESERFGIIFGVNIIVHRDSCDLMSQQLL